MDVAALKSALAKHTADLAYYDKQLKDIDAQLGKVDQAAVKASNKFDSAKGMEEKQMLEDNKGFQNMRKSMYESMKTQLMNGRARSQRVIGDVNAALQRIQASSEATNGSPAAAQEEAVTHGKPAHMDNQSIRMQATA